MSATAVPARPSRLPLMLGWRRVRFTLGFSIVIGLLVGLGWKSGPLSAVVRVVALGLVAMLVFGLFEQWPKRLPRWLACWVLAGARRGPGHADRHRGDLSPLSPDPRRPRAPEGLSTLIGIGILVAPWAGLAALVRQKDALARHQALAFDLERSELERQALDARLHLLQAQVAPHFLFNTLANVQALVDAGSPQASVVLRSLVAYLRAAVPRLDEPATTLGQELQLVQADPRADAHAHARPPAVRDARRRGRAIAALSADDPADAGGERGAPRHRPQRGRGRIDLHVQRRGDRCVLRVGDSGAGLRPAGDGPVTGLSTLQERLRLTFSGEVRLDVSAQRPRGVCAEVEFPARESSGSRSWERRRRKGT